PSWTERCLRVSESLCLAMINGRHPRPTWKDIEKGCARRSVSDEFVDVILGKLVEALRPGLYDQLEEATLNAALATIDSMRPRSELQALLAVQIIATGFAGLRFLRQSHRQMTEDFINVYGNYAIKLLRLQNEMIQTFDRYRRGNKQTVEVRHVHIHSGGQGVVGIINPPDDRDAGVRTVLFGGPFARAPARSCASTPAPTRRRRHWLKSTTCPRPASARAAAISTARAWCGSRLRAAT